MSSTSNSSHACGTAASAGHSLVPEPDSAACASGHTANVLAPLISSVCRYSPSSILNRMPNASSYSRRDSATLEVIGPKPAMNSSFIFGSSGSRLLRLDLSEAGGYQFLHERLRKGPVNREMQRTFCA